jgi:hypothetical protein
VPENEVLLFTPSLSAAKDMASIHPTTSMTSSKKPHTSSTETNGTSPRHDGRKGDVFVAYL